MVVLILVDLLLFDMLLMDIFLVVVVELDRFEPGCTDPGPGPGPGCTGVWVAGGAREWGHPGQFGHTLLYLMVRLKLYTDI